MFGSIGGFEMLVLAAIGLLVFGPRRLPEIGRTLGKAMVEFRRAAMELRTSIEREVNLEDVKETTRAIQDAVPRIDDLLPKAGDLIPSLGEEAAELTRLAKEDPTKEPEPKRESDVVGPD